MDLPYNVTNGRPEPVSLSGLASGFSALRTWTAERRRIGQITRELNRYSDRDLSDMGLTRGDIPAVARGLLPRS